MFDFKVKQVYDPKEPTDGVRVLVDRLWPRGLTKENAKLDFWDKDLAPSTELRKWFDHDIKKWPEFQKRYRAELKRNRAEVQAFLEKIRGHATVTLLFAAHDQDHNQAVVLRNYLLENAGS